MSRSLQMENKGGHFGEGRVNKTWQAAAAENLAPEFNGRFNPLVFCLLPQVRASQGRCDPERVLLEARRGLPVHQRPANPTMDSCDSPAELVLAPRSRRPHFGWGHQAQISTVTQCHCLSVPTPSPPLVAHIVKASALEAQLLALQHSKSLSFWFP